MLCKELIVERLKSRQATIPAAEKLIREDLKRAAVLIPLFFKNDAVHVLLTVRAKKMRSYSGDVAFPGGKQDECDRNDAVVTALREAREEIGLPENAVEVISQGSHFMTKSDIAVVPIVGFIPNDFSPCLNLDEVEDSFSVPLMDFLQYDKHRHRIVGRYHLHEFSHNIGNKTYITWGLTAAVCIYVASVIYDKKPDFHFSSKL